MSRGIAVTAVTAKTAHEVADNTCAAWGRRIPDVMDDVGRWAAELEETGAFEFDSAVMQILVKRSA
jgi:hypothetical protein